MDGEGFLAGVSTPGATPAAEAAASSTPATDTPTTPATETGTPATDAAAAAKPAERPDYIPEAYWDAEKGAAKLEDIGAKLKTVAEREAAAITDWDKHELKTDIKDLQGNEVTIDRDNPMVKALGGIVKERGWGPADVQPLIDTIVNAQKAAIEFEKAEFESLGDQAAARRDAVLARGAKLFSQDGHNKMMGVVSLISTAEQFKIFEELVNAAAGPRAADPRPGGNPLSVVESMYPDDVKKRA